MSLGTMFKSKGPSGFGAGSTADQVTKGLSLEGKTILLTGPTSGIGKETLRVLSQRGAQVVAAARTEAKAAAACAEVGARNAIPMTCELADPKSVRSCVEAVRSRGLHLNAIICNAGVMATRRELVYGYERQFFTNHIGHFMLVTGLLDRLAEGGRVVVVSSAVHFQAPKEGIALENLSAEGPYRAFPIYGQSKMANLVFAKELARRLQGTGKTSNALHPGVIATDLIRGFNPAVTAIYKAVGPLFLKSTAQGAATTCFVATHPSLAEVSGRYFADCNIARERSDADDPALAQRLWAKSEEIVARLN